jgi:hypothetical protein
MVALADYFRGVNPTQPTLSQPGYGPVTNQMVGGNQMYGGAGNASGGMPSSGQSYSNLLGGGSGQATVDIRQIGGSTSPASGQGGVSNQMYLGPNNQGPTLFAGGSQRSAATYNGAPAAAPPPAPPPPTLYAGGSQNSAASYNGSGTVGTPRGDADSNYWANEWMRSVRDPSVPFAGTAQGGGGGQPNVSAANQITAPTAQPPAPGIINSVAVPPPVAAPPVVQANYERIDPNLRTVQANETVKGQLAGILDEDSPLLQQARARALEQMQSRGLLNSSIAIGAGEDALIGRALQIAQPDAETYAEAAKGNQDAINAVNRYNQSEYGLTSRANADAQNQRGDRVITEGGLDRRQLVDEAGMDRRLAVTEGGQDRRLAVTESGALQRLNISEAGATNRLNISESGAMSRLNISEAGATRRQEMQNQTSLAVTQMNNDVSLATASMSRDTQMAVANLQASTSTNLANIAAANAQALNTSSAANALYRDGVQNITNALTNPDLDGPTKARLVANLEAMINQGLELTGAAGRVSLPTYVDS